MRTTHEQGEIVLGFIKAIDWLGKWTGAFAAWLSIPLMLVVVNEVVMRHLLNSPTEWGYDVCWMLFSAQFLIGGAYTLLKKGHIRIDIVYAVLSDRNKLIYDILIYLIIILPTMIIFTWAGLDFATEAWISGENLSTTNWVFATWPSKGMIPLGFFLLTLQCLAEITRDIIALKKETFK